MRRLINMQNESPFGRQYIVSVLPSKCCSVIKTNTLTQKLKVPGLDQIVASGVA